MRRGGRRVVGPVGHNRFFTGALTFRDEKRDRRPNKEPKFYSV
jgi:hypothetical protein